MSKVNKSKDPASSKVEIVNVEPEAPQAQQAQEAPETSEAKEQRFRFSGEVIEEAKRRVEGLRVQAREDVRAVELEAAKLVAPASCVKDEKLQSLKKLVASKLAGIDRAELEAVRKVKREHNLLRTDVGKFLEAERTKLYAELKVTTDQAEQMLEKATVDSAAKLAVEIEAVDQWCKKTVAPLLKKEAAKKAAEEAAKKAAEEEKAKAQSEFAANVEAVTKGAASDPPAPSA